VSGGSGRSVMMISVSSFVAIAVAFFKPFCFQGGSGRGSFALLAFEDLGLRSKILVIFSSAEDRGGELISSALSSKRLLLNDLLETARNSASRSASSADPPRSPLNVFGRLDLIPFLPSVSSSPIFPTPWSPSASGMAF